MPPRYANVHRLREQQPRRAGGRHARRGLRDACRGAPPSVARGRVFVLPDTMGDVGMALLAMWLVAQLNPAIPPFALTFDPEPLLGAAAAQRTHDLAAI